MNPGSSLYLVNGVTVASYQKYTAIVLLVRLPHTILQKLKKNSDINGLLGGDWVACPPTVIETIVVPVKNEFETT
jgi:hypothetical protein